LSSNSDTVSNFAGCDALAYRNDLSNDLVSNAEGSDREVSPSTGDSVDIGAADTTAFVDNVNIVRFEDLGGEL
jgi:hypothetical protein